jgi:hypothetical protein
MTQKIPRYSNDSVQAAEQRKADAQAALDAAGARCHAIARELGLARRGYNQARRQYETAVKEWLGLLEARDEEVYS